MLVVVKGATKKSPYYVCGNHYTRGNTSCRMNRWLNADDADKTIEHALEGLWSRRSSVRSSSVAVRSHATTTMLADMR